MCACVFKDLCKLPDWLALLQHLCFGNHINATLTEMPVKPSLLLLSDGTDSSLDKESRGV